LRSNFVKVRVYSVAWLFVAVIEIAEILALMIENQEKIFKVNT